MEQSHKRDGTSHKLRKSKLTLYKHQPVLSYLQASLKAPNLHFEQQHSLTVIVECRLMDGGGLASNAPIWSLSLFISLYFKGSRERSTCLGLRMGFLKAQILEEIDVSLF